MALVPGESKLIFKCGQLLKLDGLLDVVFLGHAGKDTLKRRLVRIQAPHPRKNKDGDMDGPWIRIIVPLVRKAKAIEGDCYLEVLLEENVRGVDRERPSTEKPVDPVIEDPEEFIYVTDGENTKRVKRKNLADYEEDGWSAVVGEEEEEEE